LGPLDAAADTISGMQITSI